MDVSQGLLLELFEYCAHTGILKWKSDYKRHKAGQLILSRASNGYIRIRIDQKWYLAHRLIWMMTFGEWPQEIDHIDGDKANNRLANLRSVTHAQNIQNANIKSTSRGVKWNASYQKWEVCITCNKKRHYGGFFHNLVDASIAATDLRKRLHGDYFRS